MGSGGDEEASGQGEEASGGWLGRFRRRYLRSEVVTRVLVLVLVVGGLLLWQRGGRVEARIAFGVGPTLATGEGEGIPREELRRLDADVRDASGERVARTTIRLPGGVEGPVTPPAVLHVARARYVARVTLRATEGRTLLRTAAFEVEGSGYQRVELRPPER